MATHLLLFSFLVLLFNNGASLYIPSQDLKSNSTTKTPSYTTRDHKNHHKEIVFNVNDYGARADGTHDNKV